MSTTTETKTQQMFSVAKDIKAPRGDVETSLSFFSPPEDGSVPYNYIEKAPEGLPQNNYGEFVRDVTIHDIRGREADFNTDRNGFGTVTGLAPSKEREFTDDESIRSNYYPEVEELLLKNLPGSPKRVFIFDHTIRRPNGKRGPVNRAHVDQTANSARSRVRRHLGDEAEELLQGRVRLVNVWRPLNGPVVASPLAYADSQTVPTGDVVGVEHRYPTWTGETAGVKYDPAHQWHYWSGMTNDERILLQCYDSQEGARTPHSAFNDPRTKSDWPGRESIEVRTLVFG
ncbi:uncharacterized protein K489DRAFT_378094 [Dissoconium aciculare CBS 342.82]|uniref:Methyltransferase n=1 Tax=Dissoconium aciculare CBS 342.82 TaxID=1314786 RepID=A0A6J3MCE8_9PEZI|nr:uncharacterized protein K489DRAFT_378094 [Dissoconium aciculare CBS 342.82]KAF1825553.1 hypothetical protein K489DRAFT_378094 [Dissoconium aciculare CBS 342.82]